MKEQQRRLLKQQEESKALKSNHKVSVKHLFVFSVTVCMS
jgi:hypothetical protein